MDPINKHMVSTHCPLTNAGLNISLCEWGHFYGELKNAMHRVHIGGLLPYDMGCKHIAKCALVLILSLISLTYHFLGDNSRNKMTFLCILWELSIANYHIYRLFELCFKSGGSVIDRDARNRM